MNKAKMTFRFDHGRKDTDRSMKQVFASGYDDSLNRDDILRDDEAETPKPTAERELEAETVRNPDVSGFTPWQSSFDIEVNEVQQQTRRRRSEPARTGQPSMDPVSMEAAYTGLPDREQDAAKAEQTHVELVRAGQPRFEQAYKAAERFGSYEVDAELPHRGPMHPMRTESLRVHPETGYIGDERIHEYKDGQEEYKALYERGRYARYLRSRNLKPGGGSWLKVTASVAGAIVTGVAFGFFVLSLFSDQEPAVNAPMDGGLVMEQGKGENGSLTAASSMASAEVNIPSKTYLFLQGGAFSSLQSSETARSEFQKQGLAAAVGEGDLFPVYIGMTLNQSDADAFKQRFREQEIDVMVKSIELPAAAKIRWEGDSASELESYLQQGSRMVDLIAAQTVLHTSQPEAEPMQQQSLQTIKSTHQALLSSYTEAAKGLSDEGKQSLQKMNNALNVAVVSLDEYMKNPSVSFMWQAQTAAMQYVLAEKKLLETIAME